MTTGRASFGNAGSGSSSGSPSPEREQDCGAVWVKSSDKDGSKYLSIKVELKPEDMKALQQAGTNAKGLYEMSLIAFPSKSWEEGSTKPRYRVLKSRTWIRTR